MKRRKGRREGTFCVLLFAKRKELMKELRKGKKERS